MKKAAVLSVAVLILLATCFTPVMAKKELPDRRRIVRKSCYRMVEQAMSGGKYHVRFSDGGEYQVLSVAVYVDGTRRPIVINFLDTFQTPYFSTAWSSWDSTDGYGYTLVITPYVNMQVYVVCRYEQGS